MDFFCDLFFLSFLFLVDFELSCCDEEVAPLSPDASPVSNAAAFRFFDDLTFSFIDSLGESDSESELDVVDGPLGTAAFAAAGASAFCSALLNLICVRTLSLANCSARSRSTLLFPLLESVSILTSRGRHWLLTSPALMNLPAALLSSANPGCFGVGFSASFSLSKYCFTRVNSWKTGCSRALTPFKRRYAEVEQLVPVHEGREKKLTK